jgi:hypothetical protein
MTKEALKLALEAYIKAGIGNSTDFVLQGAAYDLAVEALAQPEQKYRRGNRLICLETEEYCVIHISGTDRQWVKFPDSHIGVYTNEQVAELFELLPKEPEQEPVAFVKGCNRGQWEIFPAKAHQIFGIEQPLYTTPPQRKPLTDEPNLFWNDDDPEMPHSSIDEFLNDEWCNGCLEVGDVRTVQRAIRLPNETVRVTVVTDDGDIEYETIEAAHGITKE